MLLTSISASSDRMSNTFGPEILIMATPDFPKTVDKAYIVEADILTILYFFINPRHKKYKRNKNLYYL